MKFKSDEADVPCILFVSPINVKDPLGGKFPLGIGVDWVCTA